MSAAQLFALSFDPIVRLFRGLIICIQIDHYQRTLQSCQQTIASELRTEAYISKRLAMLSSDLHSIS